MGSRNQEWLDNLKAGDEVAIVTTRWSERVSVNFTTVLRRTQKKRLIVVKYANTAANFSPNGHRITSHTDWGESQWIEPRSEGHVAWRNWIRNIQYLYGTWGMDKPKIKNLPTETIEKLVEILRSVESITEAKP